MNAQLKNDIQTLLDYLWLDEEHSFEELDRPNGHIFLIMQRIQKGLEAKPKATKPKADPLPDNWQGNGRYKVYDSATKQHIEMDFESAMIHKGLTPKKVFAVKMDTKDRPKDFASGALIRYANDGLTQSYVREWLKLNHLAV